MEDYNIETEVIGLLAFLYLMGIVKGSSICMIACAPGIVPYLISKRYDSRKCLQLAIIFNIPRIIVLTISGILIGIMAYLMVHELFQSIVEPIIFNVQIIGYGLMGLFILMFGAHMLMTSVETKENLKDSKAEKTVCQKSCQPKSISADKNTCADTPQKRKVLGFLQKRFTDLQRKPNTLFFLWGGLLSVACLGESIIIQLFIFSGSLGVFSDSLLGAGVIGGVGMFLFAVGAAIPIIIVAMVSSSIGKYFRTLEKLETLRTIGAMVMIMIGLVFILILISSIIRLGM